MATKLDALVKRKDMQILDPKKVIVREGWNHRDIGDFNDEDDLAFIEYVKENGTAFPPIFVIRVGSTVELVAGHRRLRATLAAIEAGCQIEGIPATLIPPGSNEIAQYALALAENNGKPITAMDEARACKKMKNWGLDESEIAKKIGKSKSHVLNRLVLIEASPDVAKAVNDGTITQGEAMAAVKDSGGSIDKQNAKLKKIQKPSAKKAPKMMSRLKVQQQMQDLVKKATDNGIDVDAISQEVKEYCTLIGLTMVLKNTEFETADSEVFLAFEDQKAVDAVKNGKSPW